MKGAPLLFSGASSFLGGKIPAPSQERYDSALAPLFSALVAAAQGSQLKQIILLRPALCSVASRMFELDRDSYQRGNIASEG